MHISEVGIGIRSGVIFICDVGMWLSCDGEYTPDVGIDDPGNGAGTPIEGLGTICSGGVDVDPTGVCIGIGDLGDRIRA